MISKEMLSDPSISPKAKGVLCYLLSLPPNWKIYHSQLQSALNVGEEYITSAINELIDNGYADRTREKVNGKFQAYRYVIREFKKSLPNRENRTGFSGPENPELLKKQRVNIQKETTTAAAVFPNKQEEESVNKFFKTLDQLRSLEIPESDKEWIEKHYPPEKIQVAMNWALNPETIIKKTLSQALKWACEHQPVSGVSIEDRIRKNKKIAVKVSKQWKKPNHMNLEILSKYVEFIFVTSNREPICLSYEEYDFENKMIEYLRKTGFKAEQ